MPNVPEASLGALQAEPIFQRFPIHGGGWWAQQGGRALLRKPAGGGSGRGAAHMRASPPPPPPPTHPPTHTPTHTGNLLRGLVSCTGAQFCSLALVETKNRALEVGGQGRQ